MQLNYVRAENMREIIRSHTISHIYSIISQMKEFNNVDIVSSFAKLFFHQIQINKKIHRESTMQTNNMTMRPARETHSLLVPAYFIIFRAKNVD